MPKNVKKIDQNVIKSIKTSSKKFGQLYPILIDSHNQIIDGEHRRVALNNAKTFKLEKIKTKKDRLEARLVANHARKGQHKSTWIPTLSELAKILEREGIEKIGMHIAEETGLPYRTIMRYLPQEFKDEAQVKRASYPRNTQTKNKLVKERLPIDSPTKDPEEILGYKINSNQPKPKIILQRFSNQPWKAVLIPKVFYEKLEKASIKRNLNIEEVITIAFMKLLEDLGRGKIA